MRIRRCRDEVGHAGSAASASRVRCELSGTADDIREASSAHAEAHAPSTPAPTPIAERSRRSGGGRAKTRPFCMPSEASQRNPRLVQIWLIGAAAEAG